MEVYITWKTFLHGLQKYCIRMNTRFAKKYMILFISQCIILMKRQNLNGIDFFTEIRNRLRNSLLQSSRRKYAIACINNQIKGKKESCTMQLSFFTLQRYSITPKRSIRRDRLFRSTYLPISVRRSFPCASFLLPLPQHDRVHAVLQAVL